MLSVAPPLRPDLEVLHQASAGDLAAVDLLHVDALGTEEPRHQHLQVAQEIAVDLWMERSNGERESTGEFRSSRLIVCSVAASARRGNQVGSISSEKARL